MELMKNGLSASAILRISNALSQVLSNFDSKTFENECLNGLESLELKQRVHHIIKVLNTYLPTDFTLAVNLLCSIKKHWDYGDPEDSLKSFAAWPLIDYIAEYGIDFPEESLKGMKQLTSLFSAEFAIRPFIIRYPEFCYKVFSTWVYDESADVRRLVSEGTRPKLPWGMQLKTLVNDPSPSIVLLTTLRNDPSLYVRRSVANHLNDIAKDHPTIVIKTCKSWLTKPTKEIQWLIKHATRTLVKEGNTEVFPLLGYTENPKINIETIDLSNTHIKLGETITFKFALKSLADYTQEVVIDYALYFMKANGIQKAKVFKLKNQTIASKESITLTKSFSFKTITTRKYYKGEHKIEILVNGVSKISQQFNVSE